jgi:beta-glucosidase-like glycosyl hydrolase
VTDSHETLPIVETARRDLDATDLLPFRSAIAAGVDTVMTAHVAYPSLDPSGAPATASAPILKTLLREEMAFEGCVVSDSLLMDGIAGGGAPGEQAAALVAAGVDLLLDPQEPEAVVNGLVSAVESGSLPEARFNDAFDRVWTLKERAFSPSSDRSTLPRDVPDVSALPAFGQEAKQLARRGMAIRGRRSASISPSTEQGKQPEGVLCARFSRRDGEGDALLPGWDASREWSVHEETPDETIRRIREQAREARMIVCVVASAPAAWQSFGLPEALEPVVADILEAGPPSVLAVLGSPHAGDRVEACRSPDAHEPARIDLYSDEPVSRRALWDTLPEMIRNM